MSSLGALRICLVALLVAPACAPSAPAEARAGMGADPSQEEPHPAIEVEAPEAAPIDRAPIAPAFTGDVLTDTSDVRACLPLDDGAVLVGTGGGLSLVRADGTTRAPWTALDGLPETRVHALLREGERIWIGTEAGLASARLRGERLSIERSFAGKPVRALARHEGAIFVATWGDGVARLDERRGLAPLAVRGAVGEARVSSLAVHEGALYAGSPAGLHRVQGDELVPVPRAPSSIWALSTHQGRLWIGGMGGLSSMARGAIRNESSADVRALASSGDALLVGTLGQGAMEIRGGRSRPLAGPAAYVQAIAAAGSARCAGGREGLRVQRDPGAPWMAVRVPEIGSNDISALARDGERTWIGTFDSGLAWLVGDRVHRVRDAAIDDKINALAVERGPSGSRVWVATARGLVSVEGRGEALRFTRFGEREGLPSRDVHAVTALAGGGVLIGTARGAALISEGMVTPLDEKRGLAPSAVWAVAEGPDGRLLLGTSRGLLAGTLESRGVVFHGAPASSAGASSPWVHFTMVTGDLDDDWVTALTTRGRTVYVGTYNAGVSVLDWGRDGEITARKLGGGYVNMGGLLVHGDRLFAATMVGLLVRPADGSGEWRASRRAAPGKDVTAILPAGDRLWVASRRGLSRVAPAAL